MKTLKQNIAPLIAFLIAGSTAIIAYDHLSYVIPFVVFKYPIAIVVLYAFFQLIAYAERRRSAQLDEVGLLRPLRDGAFLVCLHAHLRDLGIDLNLLSPASSMHLALLSWAVTLIGYYAIEQPGGLPGRLIDILSPSATRITICRGTHHLGTAGRDRHIRGNRTTPLARPPPVSGTHSRLSAFRRGQ